MQTTPPDGDVLCFVSMDKVGNTAHINWGYTFSDEHLQDVANLYLFASFVLRQRVNLIGVGGNHAAVLDDALQPDNLPDITAGEQWRFQWTAPHREISLKWGVVQLEPYQDAMRGAKRMFASTHAIAPIDEEYANNLQCSRLGPYIKTLKRLPRATCTVDLELSGFGLMSRSAPKYVAPADSHLWATLLAAHYEDDAFLSVLLDVAEVCRIIELDPSTAPILQPFLAGLIVDECLTNMETS